MNQNEQPAKQKKLRPVRHPHLCIKTRGGMHMMLAQNPDGTLTDAAKRLLEAHEREQEKSPGE